MDWFRELEENEEQGLEAALRIVNEGPPSLTSRQQATASKAKAKSKAKTQASPWETAARALTLDAYPPLFFGETEDERVARAAGFTAAWCAIEARVSAALEATDAEVFAKLLDLVHRGHPGPEHSQTGPAAHGLHRIPTGVVLVGGINSADHARTFPNLAEHLKAGGCHVALLRPRDFEGGLGGALRAALRQLSGVSDARAEAFDALAAWYVVETSGTGAAAAQKRAAPVAILVEGVEATPDAALADLVAVLSEGRPALPASLILGVATTTAALQAALGPVLMDRALDTTELPLATAIARLETLTERVLLAPWPGLLLSGPVVLELLANFNEHYFSPGIVVRGWQVAALEHFRGHPLAAVAAAGVEGGVQGVKAAAKALSKPAAAEGKRAVGGEVGAAAAAAMAAWRRWALAVRAMAVVAAAAGLQNRYSVWQLYRDVLCGGTAAGPAGFSGSGEGKERLGPLDKAIRRLDAAAATELVDRLAEFAAGEAEDAEPFFGAAPAATGRDDLGAGIAEMRKKLDALEEEVEEKAGPSNPRGREAQEGEEEAAGGGSGAAAGKKKKNDRFFTKGSRTAALMSKAQALGRFMTSGKSGAGAAAKKKKATPGDAVADWIMPWLTRSLGVPPTTLPAAKIFTCGDVSALDCLTAAPRQAVHTALTRPELFLPPAGVDAAGPSTSTGLLSDAPLGMSAAHVEDAALAFQLFDQDPACANVAEWFTTWKAMHDAEEEEEEEEKEEEEEGNEGGKTRRGKRPAPSTQKKKDGKGKKKRRTDPARDRTLAARFSQATAELQLVGLVAPAARRSRGDAVQRTMHMPAAILGDI